MSKQTNTHAPAPAALPEAVKAALGPDASAPEAAAPVAPVAEESVTVARAIRAEAVKERAGVRAFGRYAIAYMLDGPDAINDAIIARCAARRAIVDKAHKVTKGDKAAAALRDEARKADSLLALLERVRGNFRVYKGRCEEMTAHGGILTDAGLIVYAAGGELTPDHVRPYSKPAKEAAPINTPTGEREGEGEGEGEAAPAAPEMTIARALAILAEDSEAGAAARREHADGVNALLNIVTREREAAAAREAAAREAAAARIKAREKVAALRAEAREAGAEALKAAYAMQSARDKAESIKGNGKAAKAARAALIEEADKAEARALSHKAVAIKAEAEAEELLPAAGISA